MQIASLISSSVKPPVRNDQARQPGRTGETPDLSVPDARDLFGDFEAEAARTRKAFAEERLKHLQEQTKMLRLFTLAPGALTGQTARMARELENAAEDFSGSIRTLARIDTPQQADGVETGPDAYAAMLADAVPAPMILSADDSETISGFNSLAVFLADTAAFSEGLEPARFRQDSDGERTVESARRVVDLMGRLADAAAGSSRIL